MISSGSVRCWKLCLLSSLTISIAIYSENFTLAQIAPDTTLGSESSVITPLNPSTDQIDGGAIRGKNLFHSFQEFNVDIGREVYFSNPAGIENILSRVTGNNPSKIFGKLGVLGGNANLFLINPNGMIFGSNASLNVGGSFVATTANAIGFSNQGFFSASAPNAPPVLTVNPSALLFNQIEAGSITNNSREPAEQRLDPLPSEDPSAVRNLIGLRVPDGKSLLLLGGNVNLNGGGLNALGGRVELGGVASSGTVGLDVDANNLSLSFPHDLALADISLSNRARIDTSGEGSGNIQVQGKRITLSSGSQIAADTLGSKSGGAVVVNASDSVNLIGRSQNGILSSRTLGTANAGEITINTGKLTIRDGAQVLTSTNNQGSGGNLTVNAFDSIELIGTSPVGTPSGLFTSTAAAGNAGEVTINTGKLIARDGAVIATETTSQEEPFGITLATGQGGNLTVKADDSVEVIGTDAEGFPSNLSASAQGSGDGGNVKIATGRLLVRDGAEVSVSSQGTGDAGNLDVKANSVRLENGGNLLSTSTLGNGGGNITLNNQDLLLLRGNSEISTNAGGAGNGGNININTDVLAATDGSNITAKAIRGRGGSIQIATQGLFVSPDSQISAASEQGINGVVEINRPDIDPTSELVTLPAQIVDVSKLVASGCPAGGGNLARGTSEFVVTGRGGLPPNPAEATRSDTVLADLGRSVQSPRNRPSAEIPSNNLISSNTSAKSTTLVEASGWVIGSKGEIILTANNPTFISDIPWLKPNSCNGS